MLISLYGFVILKLSRQSTALQQSDFGLTSNKVVEYLVACHKHSTACHCLT